jgi:Trk K+ transport system NAD-binding subunit
LFVEIPVVAIKKEGEAEFEFVPKANTVLTREHILAVIGKEGAIKDMEP